MTPLHIASIYGHEDIVRELITAGARISCKDDDNGTPLQFAAAEGNLPVSESVCKTIVFLKMPGVFGGVRIQHPFNSGFYLKSRAGLGGTGFCKRPSRQFFLSQ